MKKILSVLLLLSVMIPVLSFAESETEDEADSQDAIEQTRETQKQVNEQAREAEKQRVEQAREAEKNRLEALKEDRASTTLSREDRVDNRIEIMGIRIERPLLLASSTEMRLENRENNIERIRDRIASTTLASTTASTTRRLEKLDDRLAKQEEQMDKVKERLQERETKVMDVLGQIASKIHERITILEGRGLDMATATAKLAEASAKIEAMTLEGDALATLINTEITASSSDQLFIDIKASQDKIRAMAMETKVLLIDTIKEITKVLPARTATSTATSTE